MKKYLSATVLLISSFSLLLFPIQTKADSIKGTIPQSSFSVSTVGSDSPSIFISNAKEGDKLQYKVKVTNISKERASFKIYPTDVLSSIRGGWSYPDSLEDRKLVGSWFKEKGVKEYALDPNKSGTYEFSLTVPKGIKDGQYIGAIIVEQFIPYTKVKNSEGMSMLSNMNLRNFVQTVINVNIEKALNEIEIKDIYHESNENGLVSIYIPHENKGTILEKPKGELILKNSSGELIKEESYSMDSVYVGTTGLYDMNMNDILRPDTYTLTYKTTYVDKELIGQYEFKITQKEVVSAIDKADNMGQRYKSGWLDFLYMYWVWILITGIFIIILIMIIILLLLRMRKEKKTNTTTHQGDESEHVQENKNVTGL